MKSLKIPLLFAFATIPGFCCLMIGESLPDSAVPAWIIFVLLFTWSEFGILLFGTRLPGKPFIRSAVFPPFACALTLVGGINRISTLASCLLGIILVLLADTVSEIVGGEKESGFARTLGTIVAVAIAGYAAWRMPIPLACATGAIPLLVLSAHRRREPGTRRGTIRGSP